MSVDHGGFNLLAQGICWKLVSTCSAPGNNYSMMFKTYIHIHIRDQILIHLREINLANCSIRFLLYLASPKRFMFLCNFLCRWFHSIKKKMKALETLVKLHYKINNFYKVIKNLKSELSLVGISIYVHSGVV